ncbi:MAG: hypothetical protein ACR2H1_14605 [Limisphaerales bacterium]
MGTIAGTAQEIVQNLDGIVWAVNPENDSLERSINYLQEYAEMFLRPSGIFCRFEIPENLPSHPLSSRRRATIFF